MPPLDLAADLPWVSGVLAAVSELLAEASDELNATRPMLTALLPATDWSADAARGFHERVGELETETSALCADVDAAAVAAEARSSRLRVVAWASP